MIGRHVLFWITTDTGSVVVYTPQFPECVRIISNGAMSSPPPALILKLSKAEEVPAKQYIGTQADAEFNARLSGKDA